MPEGGIELQILYDIDAMHDLELNWIECVEMPRRALRYALIQGREFVYQRILEQTSSWRHPPKFSRMSTGRIDEATAILRPSFPSETNPWVWVEFGTKPHVITARNILGKLALQKYDPKSYPESLEVGPGVRYGPVTRKWRVKSKKLWHTEPRFLGSLIVDRDRVLIEQTVATALLERLVSRFPRVARQVISELGW